jgi:flavin-dependent dehydrogenase
VRADSEAFFDDALARFPDLPAQVRGAPRGPLLASGPFDLPTRAVYAPGAALVGDAAGYFDPFTGQGIYQAMAGAELLVDAVADALAREHAVPSAALAAYAAAHRRLTAGPRRVQRLIDAVLARPRTARRALLRLGARPRVAHALLAVTGDLAPAGSLLSPGLLVSFLLPQPRKS